VNLLKTAAVGTSVIKATSLSIEKLKDKYVKLWESTSDSFPDHLAIFGNQDQETRDARLDCYIDELIRLIKKFPGKEGKCVSSWGTALKKLIYDCGTDVFEFDAGSMRILLEKGFCESTSDFVTEAKRFDENFNTDDILQALRNVWIMNCLQILMGLEVKATPSVFAYSMLYPYTDNFLDDGMISEEIKKTINQRFERRLAGECIRVDSEYEARLFKLVEIIESQFNRRSYPLVYDSLLSIHSAQAKSLKLHDDKLDEGCRNILDISFEKGGSSVLADACLVKGNISPEEASFAFGFGIVLQLLDDLQDASVDHHNGHKTLFSGKNTRTNIEKNTNRLFNFTCRLMNENSISGSPEAAILMKTIRKSIDIILFMAIASNGMYSRDYLSRLEIYSPISFRYCKKLNKRISKEYGRLKMKFAIKPLEVEMANAFARGEAITL